MNTCILDNIHGPDDLKELYNVSPEAMGALSGEIRARLIDTVSKNGGHLAPNLGVVELTIAMHLAFDMPKDTVVFDVGHQSYVHKLLTGRHEQFSTLRRLNGISGFPKRSESEYDAFNTGHAGTSVSAALGIARAKRLKGDQSYTIAFIGDGACTSGMVFEAMNDAGQTDLPLIIVLNDNEMSIGKPVGAFNSHLGKLRSSRHYRTFKSSMRNFLRKLPHGRVVSDRIEHIRDRIKFFMLPNRYFESLGIAYLGPIDGHDIDECINAFKMAKKMHTPTLLHFQTIKGKGYAPAEDNPEKFHGIGAFDVNNPNYKNPAKTTNSQVFGDCLLQLAKDDPRIVAITAAMPTSTGLKPFSTAFPERFFDVGIAEEHAVTMAAGLASQGMRPVVALYSTFLQRSYDQLLHDVCLQKLPVVFGVDRAGLVGDDGETHQGVYDIAFLKTLPYMNIFSPSTLDELRQMLSLALTLDTPTAIRYNRGALSARVSGIPITLGKWEILRHLSRINVVATGRLVDNALRATGGFGEDVGLINAGFISPMDDECISQLAAVSKYVITVEGGLASCGFGVSLMQKLSNAGVKVTCLGAPDTPVVHASVAQQDALCSLSAGAIRMGILKAQEALQ